MDLFNEENGFITYDKVSSILSSDISREEKMELMKKVSSFNVILCRNKKIFLNRLSQLSDECEEIADLNLNFHNGINNSTYTNNDFLSNKFSVSSYVSLINNFSSDLDFDKFGSSIDNSSFLEIINSLIAYYTLEDVTLKKMIYEAGCELFENEKCKIDFILSNLFRLRDSYVVKNEVSYNKIIYTKTDLNNVNFLSDLDKIPSDFYENVGNAFNSILDGSFKNMKRLGKSDEGFACALFQVRDSDIRIFYSTFDFDVYIVGGVIVKKVSTSRDYSTYVRKISRDIKACKESLSGKKYDLEEHDNITKEVIKTLKLKRRGEN